MIVIIIKFIFLPLLSPLGIGIVRKIKAYMQNRQGASIMQPYFDLWKLFHKDEIIAHDASWIFRLTPILIFAISIILPLGIPLITQNELFPTIGDFVVIAYLLAAMTFFLALAGIDTGSAFGGFGSSREMTLAALTEGSVLFSILPVALITHTTNIISMASLAANLPLTSYFPIVIAFLGFFIALMAETGRIPFDNPATHLELTMIHEAMILEYSGKRLALIEWAAFNKFLFFIILGMNLFFPWSVATQLTGTSLLYSLGWLLVKVGAVAAAVVVVETTNAKLRLFRVPDLLSTAFILAALALLSTFLFK